MKIFQDYAKFYDDIYWDKNYSSECDFLEMIFKRFSNFPVRTILDLGCGTGGHAFIFAQRNYVVTGIDQSKEMLDSARTKAKESRLLSADAFQEGDIRTLNIGKFFDVVVSMFAAIAYMTTNKDILSAFHAARRHLNPGGLFIFDTWSGWAVLNEQPADRRKVVENDREQIIRFVHPELDMLHHIVSVNYKILKIQGGHIVNEFSEVHRVRFLFPQEVSHYLNETGFVIRKICPFMRLDDNLTEQDWNMTVVAQAK